MKEINLVYIDDSPDIALSKYLDQNLKKSGYRFKYSEIVFVPSDGYESLMKNPLITHANIVIIDSMLFENKDVKKGKFSGEEFKIILRKYFPFIETIVITQNEPDDAAGTLPKFDSRKHGGTANEYYNRVLPSKVFNAIETIRQYQFLSEKLRTNTCLDKYLVEKIEDALNGQNTYDELTKTDVDRLIAEMQKL